MNIFIDRIHELNTLRRRYDSGNPEFLVLYGRRRVGKSELIDQFISLHNGIRFLAREESKQMQIRRFTQELADYLEDPILRQATFSDWDGFFEYLVNISKNRIIIALDEFPWLVQEDKSLPSRIQDFWDRKLQHSKIFLILCGSSISFMESSLMGEKSPVFGRRTGQILLRPLRFIDVHEYIGDLRKSVEFYGVFGGTPMYIVHTSPNLGISDNIINTILEETSYLYRDVEFVLRMELSEPRYYYAILSSIAHGNATIANICNDTGLAKGHITKYLAVLGDLHLVRRELPVLEKETSKKGRYFLNENLFSFWFRFVNPNRDKIERGRAIQVYHEKIEPLLYQYLGKRFEEICHEILVILNDEGLLPFKASTMGRWWHREEEIDLVAISEDRQKLLYCEFKWQDEVNGNRHVLDLQRKAAHFPGSRETKRHEYFLVIARSFIKQTTLDESITFWDLNELEDRILLIRTTTES